jgi:protein arginine N-methyltransferase 3
VWLKVSASKRCIVNLPIKLGDLTGSIVKGTFYCRKSEVNSRELDVEIHYSVKQDAEASASDVIVQMYKVR